MDITATTTPSQEKMCRKTHISNEANEPTHLDHMCQPYLYRLDNEYINDCNDADVISLPRPRDRCHVRCPYVTQLDPPKPTISAKNAQRVEHKVEEVQQVFVHALQLYKPNEIMFSFNGGKDCTVVLDMLCRFYRNSCLRSLLLPVLYIQTEDMFPEVEEFVDKCAERYAIELNKYKGGMKEAILHMMYEYPAVKAVVMGLRSSDPHCENLRVMQHTDPGWPPLMRINPILDWTYCDVWNYLLYYNIPYCALYDQGYTSLGNKSNTRRNEHLRCVNPECTEPAYFPAYYLEDGARERDGRL